MENVVLFSIPVLFAAAVLSLLIYVFWASTRTQPIERNEELIYSERCGGLAGGGMRFRGPFVRLSIYKEFLVLSHVQQIVLKFSEIKSVESGGLWGTAVCIHHNKKYVGPIQLAVANHQRLRTLLEGLIEEARRGEEGVPDK